LAVRKNTKDKCYVVEKHAADDLSAACLSIAWHDMAWIKINDEKEFPRWDPIVCVRRKECWEPFQVFEILDGLILSSGIYVHKWLINCIIRTP
jgi:hypothetical protein